MKKISYVLIIRIAAIVLMLAALVAASFGSNQAAQAFLLPIKFQGEYSLDNGESRHNKRSLREKGDFTLFGQNSITELCGAVLLSNTNSQSMFEKNLRKNHICKYFLDFWKKSS